MMRPDISVRIVKELKGAPLSVWMALIFAGNVPVSQDWLVRNTGYTDKPIRQGLAYLFEHGFVTKVSNGWMLSDGAGQLPLNPALDIETGVSAGGELTDGHSGQPISDQNSPNRKNSDSPISIFKKGFKDSQDPINTNSGGRKNSGQTGRLNGRTGQFCDFPDLGEALMDVGIRENARTRRLLGRITPQDVRLMAAKIRDDPYHDLSETGLMVAILEGMAQRNERRGGYESWNLSWDMGSAE